MLYQCLTLEVWNTAFPAYWTASYNQGIPLAWEESLSDSELLLRFCCFFETCCFQSEFPLLIFLCRISLRFDYSSSLLRRISQTGCNCYQMFWWHERMKMAANIKEVIWIVSLQLCMSSSQIRTSWFWWFWMRPPQVEVSGFPSV